MEDVGLACINGSGYAYAVMINNRLTITTAQLNPTVGDIAGNIDKARRARREAARAGADIVIFPELYVSGYPPEDLVLKPAFQRACREAVATFAGVTQDGGPAVVMGVPWRDGDNLYNAACVLDEGRIVATRYKVDLPNYAVFDEKRVFAPGKMPGPVNIRGVRIGVPICEDIWEASVCECLMETGSEILLVINGSPWRQNKSDTRLNVIVARVRETGLPMLYCNQVGGQDQLLFDGASLGLNTDHSLAFQLPAFEETLHTSVWERGDEGWAARRGEGDDVSAIPEGDEAVWRACVLGLRDYVEKNRFRTVVMGLSGGIDSAVCAAMAVDALGAERVHCIMMPYHYTSDESLRDAKACAEALGVRYDIIPIEAPVAGFAETLTPVLGKMSEDVTHENIQSRARGVILMALSNALGSMVVTTGNKSEMSVGYATLYGDMNGGFNPIKDVYKMQVYAIARWRNDNRPVDALGPAGEVIPHNIIEKTPSAELRPDQTDQDSLPPYEVLDDILSGLIEEELSVSDIVAHGHDRALVTRIENLVYIAEYKRRQAAPGVRVSHRNFGRDRRYPITNGWRDARAQTKES